MAAAPKIIVVGGGLAASAVIKIAEMGGRVNAVLDCSGEALAFGVRRRAASLPRILRAKVPTWKHFDDTVFVAAIFRQPAAGQRHVRGRYRASSICSTAWAFSLIARSRACSTSAASEGLCITAQRCWRDHRQQLLYALDEQVRRYEAEGKVKKSEHWEFLSAVLDGNRVCRGIRAMDLRSMEVRHSLPMPSSSPPAATARSSASQPIRLCVRGLAQSALYQQGCYYANGEFIQVHPTCIPGEDKLRLMSESAARGEGGRVWVPKTAGDKRDAKSIPEGDRWYFLEEWYPKYGNLVPRDIATRAIFKVVFELNLGIDGKPMVYLDLTHIDRKILDRKLEGILEIYEKFVGDDPRDTPMKIFPGMHYTMGGLWVDFKQATNIPGIYAAGECEYQYHGANDWREFAGLLHLRRRHCRAERGEIYPRFGGGC